MFSLFSLLQALFELELAGCNEITEAGLWACLTPRIVSLTLTDCINVADEAVSIPKMYIKLLNCMPILFLGQQSATGSSRLDINQNIDSHCS